MPQNIWNMGKGIQDSNLRIRHMIHGISTMAAIIKIVEIILQSKVRNRDHSASLRVAATDQTARDVLGVFGDIDVEHDTLG
jgi:hypothetical protein